MPALRLAVLAVVALVVCQAAFAAAWLPRDDAVVLERLPEKGDPALKQLKALRAAQIARRDDVDLAVTFARRAIEASRETGDPRYLGQAQAALAPWWRLASPPVAVRVLRATIHQSLHDFVGALADLDATLQADPPNVQALLTRATVLTVLGRYAEARRDCAALSGRTTPLVLAACEGAPVSLSGEPAVAYAALADALREPRESRAVREWALTLTAEIAARMGDATAAERDFRQALALDPHDPYLKAAYADFLLDAHRAPEALALVRDDLRNDVLLLRVALAEQAMPERAADFRRHAAELRARFDAARERGDSVHRREEARFRLAILHDGPAALALARANWDVQREPADLRLLVDCARATGDEAGLTIARTWLAAHGLDDAKLRLASGAGR
jgi:Tfp pilus assembly protein PilF